jgi:GntR family transcriptional regulator
MADTNALFLSATDSTPMYGQIIEQVTAKILAGDWLPGQPIPSIRQLAVASRVSVITVKRAYLELERAGIIVTRPGKGSFVALSLELPRQLARQEFQAGLHGMLDAAERLQMRPAQVLQAVDEALRSRPLTPSAPPHPTENPAVPDTPAELAQEKAFA